MTDEVLRSLAERLQGLCLGRGLTVALAESCTGGLVAAAITEVPGSSGYFLGGVVSYSNGAKESLLGVPASALEAHGAVSAQVARAMATGARARFGASIAASVTGIAGPDGASPGKPVGLTYVGLVDEAGSDVRRFAFSGDRAANRAEGARAVLAWLVERVEAPTGTGTGGRRRHGSRMTRTAADVGAGLAPAREARPIRAGERIHVIGAAGAGASAAALLGARAGAVVTGCDAGGPSPYSPALDAAGIPLTWAHDPAHVLAEPHPDRVAVTKALTAVAPDHPELKAARSLGIEPESWQQVVADAALGRRLVAVAGTHGKSTSAGWLVHVLAAAGRDPSAFVGALLASSPENGPPATARLGQGTDFVVEADEYAGNFDAYRPAVAILTGAEWDHPDVFADRDAVLGAFEDWIRGMRPGPDGAPPTLVANVGDAGAAEIAGRLVDWPGRLVAVALVDAAPQRIGGFAKGIADRFRSADGPAHMRLGRITATTPASTTLEIHGLDALAGPSTAVLATAGRHNASNALCVAAAANVLGVGAPDITTGLGSFGGVGRRLERKGEARGVTVYDDYGHHPTAIRATIAAVRQREPERRVWAVYEPLTFHRTAAMLGEFAAALATADAVAIADIWASRDPNTRITSPGALADAVGRLKPAIPHAAPGSVEATAAWLSGEVTTGDVVLVMGGGRSYRIGELLLEALEGP